MRLAKRRVAVPGDRDYSNLNKQARPDENDMESLTMEAVSQTPYMFEHYSGPVF